MSEVRLYPPKVWSEAEGEHDYECYLDAMKRNKVGDVVRCWAGAPGCGYVDHRITRMDATGVYAVEIKNTMREMDPWEVM